jgi:hypothetical protein
MDFGIYTTAYKSECWFSEGTSPQPVKAYDNVCFMLCHQYGAHFHLTHNKQD